MLGNRICPGKLGRGLHTLAGVQHRETDDRFTFVANDDVVICHLAVSRMAGLLIVHVQRIRLGVIREPHRVVRRPIHCGNQLQILLNVYNGHSCLLFESARNRRVTKAVMMNPSSACSRYTATRCFPVSSSLTARCSPSPPSRIRSGCETVATADHKSASSLCSSAICVQRSSVSRIETPFLDTTRSITTPPCRTHHVRSATAAPQSHAFYTD